MTNFPELNTERLKLRKVGLNDISSLVNYANNENISKQVFTIPFPYTQEDAIARLNFVHQGFLNKERYVFAIALKETNELIGEMGLHLDAAHDIAQIGYWIAEPFWGKGIASEALSVVLKFGFEALNLNKIYATHYPENPSSGKVMIKNKMIKEGELVEHYKIKGVFRTVIQYRLTKGEYLNISR